MLCSFKWAEMASSRWGPISAERLACYDFHEDFDDSCSDESVRDALYNNCKCIEGDPNTKRRRCLFRTMHLQVKSTLNFTVYKTGFMSRFEMSVGIDLCYASFNQHVTHHSVTHRRVETTNV